ncbi:hypothetical protein RDV64_03425 [Acuticoccus sp. MNP-M23]|uniref:beta strand repeat-containing protein n=1 Tax=Acuticoccus sp. MNP-M23 TaxID=3072793 RepID=UPI002814C972|nr:hypothetical protein [Acuticoccus sp. MNP-M23]WMS43465.1 hypothetical protein RDV64_03425 [Acuticoccus sp. MNP-M23]
MPTVIDLSDFTASQTQGFIIQGDADGDHAGWSVSAAGDVNGDGIADVIVGANSGDDGGTNAGEAYVVYGRSGGLGNIDLTTLTAAEGFIIQGDTANDNAGYSVSAAGDVNGDGIADVIVGAPYGDDGGGSAGEAYVVYGRSVGGGNIDLATLTAAEGFIIQGDAGSDNAGYSVSAAGDVNGDGIDDVIVGAPYGDGYVGEAYVVYGRSGGGGNIDVATLTTAEGFIIQTDTVADYAGWSVSAAGDVNGDGIADVIVGAPYGDDGGGSAGEAYVVYGRSGGVGNIDLATLTAAEGFIIQGDDAFDYAGWSVSAAGDVNGDGIDDVIVGAYNGDDGGFNAGEAYVVYGRSGEGGNIDLTALTTAEGFIVQGDTAGDYAGYSVSAAGDVNGDGIDDVIVGARYGSDGGSSAGEAYVVYGRSGGIGNIDLTTLTAAEGFIIQGDIAYDYAGYSVSAAGDVNGDGIDDVIVGAPYGDDGGSSTGEAYVVYGFRTLSVGADTVTGTSGDDTVTFTAATLSDGDSFDGGAGTDTVALAGGGTFDFTGVTLTSVEAIVTDGTDATLILPDASYVPFVTSLGGSDDTVVLFPPVDVASLFALIDAGAETITFERGVATASVTSPAEDRIEIVYTDASEDGTGTRYQTQTQLMDRDGDLRQVHTVFDDGHSATTNYDEDGVITQRVVVDGPGNTKAYTSITSTYVDGVRSQMTKALDNTLTLTKTYAADGQTPTETTVRDGAGDVRRYETLTTSYNADGSIASRVIDHDDDDPRYTSAAYDYDASGAIVSQTLNLTGGGATEKTFEDGVLVLREGTDEDGNRTVFGFDGDQVIAGGSGDDLMEGGAGNDRFVFADDTRSGGSFGTDFVRDFTDEEDRLDLTDYGITSRADAEAIGTVTEVGRNTVIDLGADGAVTLRDFALANLTDDDFVAFT